MAEDEAPSASMPAIAVKIQETRVSLKWTQADLAERAAVSRPTIARIERGDGVSTVTLEKVATALGLRVELKSKSPI